MGRKDAWCVVSRLILIKLAQSFTLPTMNFALLIKQKGTAVVAIDK